MVFEVLPSDFNYILKNVYNDFSIDIGFKLSIKIIIDKTFEDKIIVKASLNNPNEKETIKLVDKIKSDFEHTSKDILFSNFDLLLAKFK